MQWLPHRQSARAAAAMAAALALSAPAIRAAEADPVLVNGLGANGPGAPAVGSSQSLATYADLATLAESSSLVLDLRIRLVALVEPARAPNVPPGWGRLYIEAEPVGVLRGPQAVLPVLRYLVDMPLDSRGRPPELKKQVVMVFAHPVEADQGQLRLVAPTAQLPWSPDLEARTVKVLADLAAPGAPGRVNGVREAMFVPGDLAGEGETQIFLDTAAGTPASITVVHEPGKPPRWSASFTEVVDSSGSPPPPGTLAWYRLACFLPDTLPPQANVSEDAADRDAATADYLMIRQQLGVCARLWK